MENSFLKSLRRSERTVTRGRWLLLAGIVLAAGTLAAAETGSGQTGAGVGAAPDPGPADISAQGADLEITKLVDNPNPSPGDTIVYTVTAANNGPQLANGVEVTDILPVGLTLVSATADRGDYNQVTGIWSFLLQKDTSCELTLTAVVGAGAAGWTIVNSAMVTASSDPDPVPDNNSDSASLIVSGFDLALSKSVDDPAPQEGETVVFLVNLRNAGTNPGSGIEVTDLLPAGLNYAGHAAEQGSYDPGSGVWTVGSLAAGDSLRLTIDAQVASGTSGLILTNSAAITACAQVDGNSGNDSDVADVTPQASPASAIAIGAVTQKIQPLRPGGQAREALRLELVNIGLASETLSGIVLANNASGPGSPVQLDADWSRIDLWLDQAGTLVRPVVAVPGAPLGGPFSDGVLALNDLAIELAPGDTVRLVVMGQATLTARDGDLLGLAVLAPEDLIFTREVVRQASWPVAPPPALVIDGMVADQLDLRPIEAMAFIAGSSRNLALDVGLPANGYEGDRLDRLNVVNQGDAVPGRDIGKMEAFADDGDESFDPLTDALLGAFSYTGNRWELTGLSHEIPLAGLRIYITVDIGPDAEEGWTIKLGLPALPDVGIGMASGNDGPLDQPVVNPYSQTISTASRVILTTAAVESGPVAPGGQGILLFHLAATNTHDIPKRLTGLTFVNDPDTDPIIGTAGFSAGHADFDGLAWDLLPAQTEHLFLTADVSLTAAADGDVIGAVIAGGADLQFADPTSLMANWPLDSGRRTVDGLVAAQVALAPVPPVALAAGDGPILALDVTIPANGYAADVLNGLELVNLGSSGPADLADLRLWRDGGDGIFTPGAGDDVELGPMVWLAGSWLSPALAEPIPIAGLRLFAGLTVGAAPSDSATVRLAVPSGGITTASDNDGPIDAAVANPNALLLSTAPLLASLLLDTPVSTVGQDLTVRMVVRNVGGEDVLGIVPSALSTSGDGSLSRVSGPAPAGFDLSAGETDTFTWTYAATAGGQVQLTGDAAGVGALGGLPRSTLPAVTYVHRVYLPADELALYPLANMPFSISRGQPDVVPLTLTFRNAAPQGTSDILLRSLKIRLQDENGAGIVPDQLLARVVVSEGTIVYLAKTDLESAGDEVDLDLTEPVRLTAGEMVTLALKLDHLEAATAPAFRVIVVAANAFAAEDAFSGAPVNVALQEGDYPIISGLCRVVAEATELNVACPPSRTLHVSRGQPNVALMVFDLQNIGLDALSADVQVGAFEIGLTDTNGVPLPEPWRVLERIRVTGPYLVHLNRPVTVVDDTMLTLFLSPPLAVPANAPTPLMLFADITETAVPQALRVRLGAADRFDARDGNTGEPVPVQYGAGDDEGSTVIVEEPATALLVSGEGILPAGLTIGARAIEAMRIALEHPGPTTAALLRVDSLRLYCLDPRRSPLPTASVIDRLSVRIGGQEVGAVLGATGSDGRLEVALTGVFLEPGEMATLSVWIDVETTAPVTGLELIVPADGLIAVDANLLEPVSVAISDGGAFPLSSGLTWLQAPADALIVDFAGRLPAVLAADGSEVVTATLLLTNPAPAGVGGITVESLTLRAADRELAPLVLGGIVREVFAYHDEQVWAASSPLEPQDTTGTVWGAPPLLVNPQQTVALTLAVRFHSGAAAPSLRLGVRQSDIGVVQPDGALLAISVQPAPGKIFPFWSEAGSFTAAGLGESFVNYPNPFAAGREKTTFAYFLPRPGRVTLRILTPYWETVRTLVDAENRGDGLVQVDPWDGRNGRGSAVQNGVYLAELMVRFDDGTSERILRKVAVVR
jgi:uncharacterized repeat protein (TIGR01451 family)